jgi:hypothetical protein
VLLVCACEAIALEDDDEDVEDAEDVVTGEGMAATMLNATLLRTSNGLW